MNDADVARRLLSIVGEIFEGGKDIIGARWTVFKKMKDLAERDDFIEMVRYFEQCLQSPRGKQVARRLTDHNRKTLESEQQRFMNVVAEVLVEARTAYRQSVKENAHRRRVSEALEAFTSSESIGAGVKTALRRKLKTLPTETEILGRFQTLPLVLLRVTPQGSYPVRHYLEQAVTCYLLGLSEASGVLARTTLEVLLRDRLDAKTRRPLNIQETGEFLRTLIESAADQRILTADERSAAIRVKKTGDDAAHGHPVDASRVRSSLKDLRRLIQSLYG